MDLKNISTAVGGGAEIAEREQRQRESQAGTADATNYVVHSDSLVLKYSTDSPLRAARGR